MRIIPSALCAFVAMAILSCTAQKMLADEIVIDRTVDSAVSIGDFFCSPCSPEMGETLNFEDYQTGAISAGRLWQFFNERGVDSLESLVLCVDLTPNAMMSKNIGIESLEFKICDPSGELIASHEMGSDCLIVPDYEVTTSRPEAQLEVPLGYDFMKRFSASSQEQILVNFNHSDHASTTPVVSIGSIPTYDSRPMTNVLTMVLFVAFWGVVFVMLNQLTRPMVGENEAAISAKLATESSTLAGKASA